MEDFVVSYVVTGLAFWSTAFLVMRALMPKRSYEFCNRAVSTMHAVAAVGMSCLSVADWSCPVCPLNAPSSQRQMKSLAVTLSYMIYDAACCHLNGDVRLDNTVHHLVSIVGIGAGLAYQRCGTEMMACMFITEISSPLLHLREMLKELGVKDTDLNLTVDILFARDWDRLRVPSPPFPVPPRSDSSEFLHPMASPDISIDIRPEFMSFDLRNARYLSTDRPWLKLYGVRLPPVSPFSSLSSRPDPALIHQCLPDELLIEIFARMSPYTLGRAASVCRKWKYTARNPTLWRNACLKTWQRNGMEANYKMVQSLYDSSWRKMWVQRPRIQIDGLYVSRNTYIHTGITEWQFKKTVNVVCYYRYLRFFPSGKFLYKISPQKVKDVVKCMHLRASKGDSVFKGDYTLSEDGQIEMALLYPGHRYTLVRMRLRVRGTTLGANNRLDVLKILTTGVNGTELKNWKGNILELIEGWEENETHDPDVPAVSHSRGLTPFVFIPFEEVDTSVLNLPVEKMDYFVPG